MKPLGAGRQTALTEWSIMLTEGTTFYEKKTGIASKPHWKRLQTENWRDLKANWPTRGSPTTKDYCNFIYLWQCRVNMTVTGCHWPRLCFNLSARHFVCVSVCLCISRLRPHRLSLNLELTYIGTKVKRRTCKDFFVFPYKAFQNGSCLDGLLCSYGRREKPELLVSIECTNLISSLCVCQHGWI